MELSTIVRRVNTKLAGEMLSYEMVRDFLDDTIDEINAKLNSTFPVFSDFTSVDYPDNYPDYNFFPDAFIRSVVIPGAAYKFFIMDEEGSQVADMYGYQYKDALFRMERDYAEQVPEVYQSSNTGSVILDDIEWDDDEVQVPFYFPLM